MPLTRFAADAFGVVTICLVALLILLGLFCIIYSCYFRSRIHSEGCIQLSYFSGPWIIRITFILFVIWWGVGEISRLSFLREDGGLLHDLKWQETICKCYIVSNLGFAEPCLFLTLLFLLRGPLQNMESGILSRKWNRKTAGYIFLYCFPVFVLQIVVILIGPRLNNDSRYGRKLPKYFTSAVTIVTASSSRGAPDIALCTYPLLSIILLGFFASILTIYLFWLGRQILKLVINKNLQRRVYTLIFSVSGFLPLRVILLGFSVSRKPEQFLFEALTFSAFLVLLCCAGLCICMLVYLPVADSLALGNLQDLEARRRSNDDHNDTISLIANQPHVNDSSSSPQMSPARNSDASSTKRGSISFRTFQKDGASAGMGTATFVELSLFSPSREVSPPGSPPLLGWPMRST
ncbi:hypothetical protein IC582_014287 [Cucumis melo]|uniref:Uncharacterized protein LOC103493311 n=2 Tax=Cucumis melo TaxID=3656 RepID=A0A1S3BSS4_CUCME|nr:uncharacterized protein LOC103493311 [Cucumis melo]XP_008452237.1 uncharacterized protein LOC103493311 [Cucumis melo]KAA0060573.1 uncharacterized protein E6C27_scaffold22G004430 [Cucumis melo var. makuwa]TYK02297.1 uncharacterized protein E5676_scaffold18G001060 [Cucumis melo var. makuwa]